MTFDFVNNTIHILHIDDDEQDYIILRDLLEDIADLSIELEWEATYEKSVDILKRNDHDLCLLDYYLGERNGLELMQEAKQVGSQIPIIMMTGTGNRTIDWEAMRNGAIYYVDKNRMDEFDLERAIRYGIEHATLLRQVRDLNETLEERVEQCTHQLREAKDQLEIEIAEREKVQLELNQLREQREQETLKYLERESPTRVTSRLLGLKSLQESAPQTFMQMVEQYEQILESAIQRRAYWVENDTVSDQLINIADTLGRINISPRDLVMIYNTALKNKRSEDITFQKSQAYMEEGRLTLLELMGYLINYYKTNGKHK